MNSPVCCGNPDCENFAIEGSTTCKLNPDHCSNQQLQQFFRMSNAERAKWFKIDRSTIPEAGEGLYALKQFQLSKLITIYIGEKSTQFHSVPP